MLPFEILCIAKFVSHYNIIMTFMIYYKSRAATKSALALRCSYMFVFQKCACCRYLANEILGRVNGLTPDIADTSEKAVDYPEFQGQCRASERGLFKGLWTDVWIM